MQVIEQEKIYATTLVRIIRKRSPCCRSVCHTITPEVTQYEQRIESAYDHQNRNISSLQTCLWNRRNERTTRDSRVS